MSSLALERIGNEVETTADARRLGTAAWVLAFGAILVRVALWIAWGGGAPVISDERDYDAIAVNLVERGEFAIEPGRLTSIRPPLYPAFVAAVYRVAGVRNYRAVHLAQMVLSLVTVMGVAMIARQTFSNVAAAWAAGLAAFYPSLLAYNNLLLTETLFTTWLVLFVAGCATAYRKQSLAWLFVAGSLLGLAALTRSVLWLFPPVFAVYLLVTWPGVWSRRVLAVVLVLVGFALPVAPWAVRNTRLQETLAVIDVMGGRNFMMGNYEHTPLRRSWAAIEIEGDRSWIGVLHAKHPEPVAGGWTQGKLDQAAQREAIRFILANPGLTLRRDVVKLTEFWGLEREIVAGVSRGLFGGTSALGLVMLTLLVFGAYAALMPLGVLGGFLVPASDRRVLGLIGLLIAFISGLHTLAFGHSRYHLPLMPLIAVMAGGLLASPKVVRERRQSFAFAAAGLVIGLLMCSWAFDVFIVDFQRFADALRVAA